MAVGRYGGPAADTKAEIKNVEAGIARLQSQWTVAKSNGNTNHANTLEAQIRQQQAVLADLKSRLSSSAAVVQSPMPAVVEPPIVATMPTWQKGLAALAVLGGIAFATKGR